MLSLHLLCSSITTNAHVGACKQASELMTRTRNTTLVPSSWRLWSDARWTTRMDGRVREERRGRDESLGGRSQHAVCRSTSSRLMCLRVCVCLGKREMSTYFITGATNCLHCASCSSVFINCSGTGTGTDASHTHTHVAPLLPSAAPALLSPVKQ